MTHDTPPKRIWTRDLDGTGSQHPCWPDDEGAIAYILASEADAMVAAALREAEQNYLHLNTAAYEVWKWFETARPDLIGPRAEKLRDAVMGPRPYGVADQPASAALDKLIAEAVNEAMLQCIGIVANLRNKRNPGPLFEVLNMAMSDIEDARFAAIREKNNG